MVRVRRKNGSKRGEVIMSQYTVSPLIKQGSLLTVYSITKTIWHVWSEDVGAGEEKRKQEQGFYHRL